MNPYYWAAPQHGRYDIFRGSGHVTLSRYGAMTRSCRSHPANRRKRAISRPVCRGCDRIEVPSRLLLPDHLRGVEGKAPWNTASQRNTSLSSSGLVTPIDHRAECSMSRQRCLPGGALSLSQLLTNVGFPHRRTDKRGSRSVATAGSQTVLPPSKRLRDRLLYTIVYTGYVM
jgi:hypothetical protein